MTADSPPGSSRVQVAAAIVLDGERVLLTERAPGQSYPHLWEFPGGKVEPGETPRQALIREVREEVGIEVLPGRQYARIRYRRDGREIEVRFFLCEHRAGTPRALEVASVRWVDAAHLSEIPFIPANRDVVLRLEADVRKGRFRPREG